MARWNLLGGLLALLATLQLAVAQTAAENTTQMIIPNSTPLYLTLLAGTDNASNYTINISGGPNSATGINGTVAQAFNRTGAVLQVTPANVDSLQPGQIAVISCDAGNYNNSNTMLGADAIIGTARGKIFPNAAPGTGAIVLYSLYSTWCSYSGDSDVQIFTTTNQVDATALFNALSKPPQNQTGYIAPNNNSGPDQSAPVGAYTPTSPSTTIAMIVLYSITGVITFLFLMVIVLGAVRAHRHPERYGPRNILGMPRQSRARGMARAMLDTIPIINFGETDQQQQQNQPAKPTDVHDTDVELANRASQSGAKGAEVNVKAEPVITTETREVTGADDGGDKEPRITEITTGEIPAQVPGASTIQIEPAMTTAPENSQEGIASCPICTEDFVRGEPARKLPCNHHYHPTCIDPWLLNVSSTCPMCRIDLNPPRSGNGGADGEDEHDENGASGGRRQTTNNVPQWPYNGGIGGGARAGDPGLLSRRRVLLSGLGFLNLTHMSQANPEERLEALREIRAARQARERGTDEEGGNGENGSSRRRTRISRLFQRHSSSSGIPTLGGGAAVAGVAAAEGGPSPQTSQTTQPRQEGDGESSPPPSSSTNSDERNRRTENKRT